MIKFSFCWTARAGAEMSLNRLVAITEDLGTIADVPPYSRRAIVMAYSQKQSVSGA